MKTERRYSYSEYRAPGLRADRAPPCTPVGSVLTKHQAPWVLVLRALLSHPSSEAPVAAPLAPEWSQAWIRGCAASGPQT